MTYLFLLGRQPEISCAELQSIATVTDTDISKGIALVEDLDMNTFEAARDLQNRLGGTIRFGKILGGFEDPKKLKNTIVDYMIEHKPEGKLHFGLSCFGSKSLLQEFCIDVKSLIKSRNRNGRVVNAPGKNLNSGQVFAQNLLGKGFEFLIWSQKNYLLAARTVACQNLDWYTIRDRDKPHRDAHMGMLPPKLAQILINLARPEPGETIIDPFCGSGTIGIEAALMGHPSVNADKSKVWADNAAKNFTWGAGRMGFEKDLGTFFDADAVRFPFQKHAGVLVSEGWLGENFKRAPARNVIEQNADQVLRLWKNIFQNLSPSIRTISICLPCWRHRNVDISIAKKWLAMAAQNGYIARALWEEKTSLLYRRPDAFVGREICVVERKS